jgi:inner membrane protein
MDTPTQALLGAVVGQAFFGKNLGSRAAVWGALGGALPDADILAMGFLGPWAEFLYHRGPTHALWFGPVVGSMIGYGVWRVYARGYRRKVQADGESGPERSAAPPLHPGSPSLLGSWVGLFVLALFTHPLLDLFTTYGTQLLSPFSNRRFAIHAVSIIDPLYSLILAAALLVAFVRGARSRIAVRTALLAVVISTSYLFYGLWLNVRAEGIVREQLAGQGILEARVRCYPTILQVYLRRAVVWTQDEVRVGLLSMWKPAPVIWQRFPVSDGPLVQTVRNTWEGRTFEWFALGDTLPGVVEQDGVVVVEITDLRYGFPRGAESGLWGIRAAFDREGRMLDGVRRFRRSFPSKQAVLLDLWRATFGKGV